MWCFLYTRFFFLKAPAKDWNKVKQSFFSNVIYTKGFEFGDNYSENVTRWYSVARSGSLSKPYSRKTLIYYEARLYCKVDRLRENGQKLKRKSSYLEETEINSNCFAIAVDSRYFAELWRKGRAKTGLWPNIYLFVLRKIKLANKYIVTK